MRSRVSGPTGSGEILAGLIERDRGIPFDVQDVDDLHPGMVGDDISVAVQTLVKIGLTRDGEEDDISFSVELFDEAIGSEVSGGEVIGANEVEPLTAGRV